MMTSPNDMDRSYLPTNNEASDVETQQVPLAPPDEDLHATLEAAIHTIKLHAKQHGYGIPQFKIAFDMHTPPSPRRAPRFIIAALVERNTECLMSLRDVYIEVDRIRKELLGSISQIEALIIELEDDKWA
ncbi:hypothetical protein PsorP6_015198 [Peronosclerospora sorghi]|uniref:Uncharacterized protein n=1 Tax=Peronosclerospora sorghi TaxID=230839 RepID=A0ACC0VTC4_9STRA|nr:hypothetical protein PsorP6_015198 [Peronosclerospora sorghi]